MENMPPKTQKATLALEQENATLGAKIVSEMFET